MLKRSGPHPKFEPHTVLLTNFSDQNRMPRVLHIWDNQEILVDMSHLSLSLYSSKLDLKII